MAVKNVTLSADDALLERVRGYFERQGTSLNEQFRLWIEAEYRREIDRQKCMMQQLWETVHFDSGGVKLTREELNEREPRV